MAATRFVASVESRQLGTEMEVTFPDFQREDSVSFRMCGIVVWHMGQVGPLIFWKDDPGEPQWLLRNPVRRTVGGLNGGVMAGTSYLYYYGMLV